MRILDNLELVTGCGDEDATLAPLAHPNGGRGDRPVPRIPGSSLLGGGREHLVVLIAENPVLLGHEIEETVTDPGAEDVIGSGTATTNLGGWYDAVDANENGDKCAWVGESLGAPGEPTVTPIPVSP